MRQHPSKPILILLILILLAVFVFPLGALSPVNASPVDLDEPEVVPDESEVDPELLSQFDRSDLVDYLVYFESKADLSPAYAMDWEARGQYVYEALTATADAAQADVRAYLTRQGVEFQPFWGQNVIAVSGSNRATLDGLLDFPEIQTLMANKQIYLVDPVSRESAAVETADTRGPESNLTHINADDVWALGFDGSGMVVANIDTGVRYTHEALVDQYRGNLGEAFNHNNNWWDPVYGTNTPVDTNGHGSHTAGIMIGSDGGSSQIGVAPAAQWIACNAFPAAGSGSGADFIACGQFMLAPWDLTESHPNPSKRPHVVNNSWGDCDRSYSDWFEHTIDAWLAAGIYPVFANGNTSNCGYPLEGETMLNTVGNPARGYNVTGVGSTGRDNGEYAAHSNWGPTDSLDTLNPEGYPNLKPQFVAPGVGILSAYNYNDSAYVLATGTSMSAPHVAGLVVLMWEAGDCLLGDYVTTETLLQQSAVPIPYDTGNGDEGPGNVPNHATGWGEIDALAAVNAALNYCNRGVLNGTVTNANTNQPIGNATVTASAQGDSANDSSTTTNANGFYSMAVPNGETYALDISKNGYQPDSISGIFVENIGDIFTNNFSLVPKYSQISGTVTDGSGHGYPLYAHVTLDDGEKLIETFTNALDGTYSVAVYQDTVYNFRISSLISGYNAFSNASASFTSPSAIENAALTVRDICTAPGYRLETAVNQSFNTGVRPENWSVWDAAGNGNYWRFDDPTVLGNLTGGTGSFASIDSTAASAFINTSLVSPSLDLSGESLVKLVFDQEFYTQLKFSTTKADIDVSVGHGAWQNVLQQTVSINGPNQQEIDISGLAANQPDVRIRFHYYDALDSGWWQVDNVRAGSLACVPIKGGVLLGFVTDDSAVLRNGVTVSSTAASTKTFATPEDQALPDGFFWLFTPMTADSQTITFTAFSAEFGQAVRDATLTKNAISRLDFSLEMMWFYLALFYKQ